jgi:hypothetical protein
MHVHNPIFDSRLSALEALVQLALARHGGGAGTVIVENQGAPLGPAGTLNFTGPGVSTALAIGVATVTIPGGGGSGNNLVTPAGAITDTSAMSGSGTFAYISAAGVASPATAAGPVGNVNKARVFGCFEGVANQLTVAGVINDAQMDGSGAPAAGDPLYLSTTVPGKLTKTAPITVGQQVSEVGICLDPTLYPASVKMLLQVKLVDQL